MSETGRKYSDLTPYHAAQVATRVLRACGVLIDEAEIAPQTMYGNKTIERYGTPRREGGNGIYFVGASFAKWLDGMKRGESGGGRQNVDVDALVAEYGNGEVAAEAAASADEADGDAVTGDFDEVAGQADLSALEPESDKEGDELHDQLAASLAATSTDGEDAAEVEAE